MRFLRFLPLTALGTSNYSALIGIHTFSGCDSTIGNGWHIEDGELTVTVMTTNPAPESVLQLVHCSCKTSKCETQRCSLGVCLQDCLDLCEGRIHSMRMYKRRPINRMMTLILKAEVIMDINVNIIYLPLTYKMSGPLYIYYILYILYTRNK